MLFSDLDLNKTYSYADYYQWTFEDRVELINGKVYKLSPAPNRQHQDISRHISTPLDIYLKDKACKIYYAPFDVRLPQKAVDDRSIFTVLQPDICVVCDLAKLDKRGCIGAPDIVVEILSPGNNTKELKNKYEIYEEAGVKEYWVVSPAYQMVTIYLLKDGKFHGIKSYSPGELIISALLPGFFLDLTAVFKDTDEG